MTVSVVMVVLFLVVVFLYLALALDMLLKVVAVRSLRTLHLVRVSCCVPFITDRWNCTRSTLGTIEVV